MVAAFRMVIGRRISGYPRAQRFGPINVRPRSDAAPVEASMSKINEWDILKLQFDALADESVESGSLEDIFDIEFRRRFTELITNVAWRRSGRVAAGCARAIGGQAADHRLPRLE